MTRTTPPRPLDVAAELPELAGLARTATRLHPRRGAPTVHDSSVGGPLLWPASEPWPMYEPVHGAYGPLTTLADIHSLRRISAQARSRPRAPGEGGPTERETEVIDRIRAGYAVELLPEGPLPLIPLVQLYARDVPGLPCPEGTDVLQVLWSPFDEIEGCSGAVQLRWRRSSDVREILAEPPEPAYVDQSDHVPTPCVLHPEQVREFPPVHLLTDEQAKRVEVWAEERSVDYQGALSVAPGWKLGGWPAHFTYRYPARSDELQCGECGGPVEALLTVDSSEWDGSSRSWRPVEDVDGHPYATCTPTVVTVGRGCTLQIYACVGSPSHLPRSIMQ
ncbi:hypothetical protein FGW37_32820 [Streptomyces rectiverticillatus]|uniref:hypothetical protein n=1 Tax=Streptomyces rectiverticillatus TaxID=173860 RepID=UPI0015C3671B|nr:hypothetical protein [Streptomyces rectiverticillatus]QLE75736.1 hypothetical protein FGW37_32820 [Streptomyces rectiverticillatus]